MSYSTKTNHYLLPNKRSPLTCAPNVCYCAAFQGILHGTSWSTTCVCLILWQTPRTVKVHCWDIFRKCGNDLAHICHLTSENVCRVQKISR